MALNLHIGEMASLALSFIGMFLNFKDRKKLKMLLTIKITRFSSLWTAIVFVGIVLIAVFVFKINEIMALMACTLLYFAIENKTFEPKAKIIESIIKGFIHTIKVWPILFLIGFFSSILLVGFAPQENVRKLQNGNYSNIGIIILTACIIAPITEELIFRGMIYPLLKKGIGVFWGCAISSIIFSAIHYNVLSFAVLFVFSCCLTYIYEKYNTLLVPIISHSTFNGIMIILILFSDFD